MKYLNIAVFFALCSCATTAVYQGQEPRSEGIVRYIAEGPQPIELLGKNFYVQNKGKFYELVDFDRFKAVPNKIIIWLSNDRGIPRRYQIMKNDEYIISGEIELDENPGIGNMTLTIDGKVATYESVEIKPIPLQLKLALTPFTLAAEISSLPLIILTDPKSAGEAIKIGALALSGD